MSKGPSLREPSLVPPGLRVYYSGLSWMGYLSLNGVQSRTPQRPQTDIMPAGTTATQPCWREHSPNFRGTVRSSLAYALFQPAEETGTGAKAVLDSRPAMHTLDQLGGVDRAFAIHNIPKRPLGLVTLRLEGTMARASMGCRITFRGTQSHAAEPWAGNNPVLPLAELARYASELPARHAAGEGEEEPICTLVHLNCGRRDYGVSPGGKHH